MKRSDLKHEFVEFIPSELEEAKLYVSIPYTTAVHKCACGCGNKVVTPISPAQWQLAFDGETVSLTPSVGSWQLPCRSHYWITRDRVRWAAPWTDAEIMAGRTRDQRDLDQYYGRPAEAASPVGEGERPRKLSLRERLRRWRTR